MPPSPPLAPPPAPCYTGAMRPHRRQPSSSAPAKGVHIFINSEGSITIGQTLADDTETHVSLSAAEASLLLAKLPQMLRELAELNGGA